MSSADFLLNMYLGLADWEPARENLETHLSRDKDIETNPRLTLLEDAHLSPK